MPKRKYYIAKYSGHRYDTYEEAVDDNARYKNDILYRYWVKSDNFTSKFGHYPTISYKIPFIESKRRTLSNAGLATGAVISENMLDTIAAHAEKVGLPIKTALGIATKESTLGNWTDDGTFHKLFKKGSFNHRLYRSLHNENGTIQHINPGIAIDERELINFHDERNPYKEAVKYADENSANAVSKQEWDNDVASAMSKTRAIYVDMLSKGETYADNLSRRLMNTPKVHVLDAAFTRYKNNPNNYNPGQANYSELVNRRGNEVWASPEVQNWWTDYNKRKRQQKRFGGRLSLKGGGDKIGWFTKTALSLGKAIGIADKYKGKGNKQYARNLYNLVDPTAPYPRNISEVYDYKQIADLAMKNKSYPLHRDEIREPLADAAWAKRLGLPYDETLIIPNSDGTYKLASRYEQEIPTDTVYLKNRINKNRQIAARNYGQIREYANMAADYDQAALDSLRLTYRTGKPVGMNEHSNNSRNWIKNGNAKLTISPLSALQNYTVRYNPQTNKMEYSDRYDFNEFEDYAPGIPFDIRGEIDLNKKRYGGRISLKHGGIHINPANRGKFTATMKRTGKTASQLAHSKNPLTRKRAIFALNARKWKH